MLPRNVLLSLLLLLPLGLSAQSRPAEREVLAAAPAELFDWLRLEAKAGDVRVRTSPDDSIRVRIRIRSTDRDELVAQREVERVDVYDKVRGSLWEWDTNLDGFDIDWLSDRLRIDYFLELPAGMGLEIYHRYGDIVLPDRGGSTVIDLRWGSLSAGCLSGQDNELTLQFAEADVACLGDAEVDLTAGKLACSQAGDLRLRSRGAEITCYRGGTVTLNAHAGDYYFRRVHTIRGNCTSSHLQIDTLEIEMDMDLSLAIGAEIGLGEAAERVDLRADLAPVAISYPAQRVLSVDIEARAGDVQQLDVPDLADPVYLPDGKVRYQSDWQTARTAEQPIDIRVQSTRGGVRIRRR